MNIWTIELGEPLPIKGTTGRIMRTGQISEMLAKRGHNVTYFSSDFSHQEKRRIADGPISVPINDNYEIFLLHAKTPYYKHVSFQRLKHNRQLGHELSKELQKRDKPDVIYVCYPIPEFCDVAVQYGNKNNVPVIVDVRDLWPDVMVNVAPKKLKSLVKTALLGMEKKSERIVRNADAVVAVCPGMLRWAEKKGHIKSDYDGVMYLAYDNKTPDYEEMKKAKEFCANLNIYNSDNNFCYIGHGGEVENLFFLKEALDKINEKNIDANIIICGEGDRTPYWKDVFKPYKNVIFAGYLNKAQLGEIMNRSIGGLLFYLKKRFSDSIPNKSVEYMSHGLPALSSMEGDLDELYKKYNIGFTYKSGSELADQMLRLIENKSLRDEMSKNAKTLYESDFTVEKVYGDFCDKLEKIAVAANSKSDTANL